MPTLPPSWAASTAAATSWRALFAVELAHDRHALGAAGVVVADVEAGLDAVENRRRDGDIAGRGGAMRDRADVVIDAKNLLHDHHAAARLALRRLAPGGELETRPPTSA